MFALLKSTNLALAFGLELAMLAAFVAWGLSLELDLWLRWVTAAVLVAVAIAIWARWAAPNSATRLGLPGLVVLKLVLFALATAALWAAGRPVLAIWFGGLVVLNLILAAIWQQQ